MRRFLFSLVLVTGLAMACVIPGCATTATNPATTQPTTQPIPNLNAQSLAAWSVKLDKALALASTYPGGGIPPAVQKDIDTARWFITFYQALSQ